MARDGMETKKLVQVFYTYLENDGNVSATAKESGCGMQTVNRYRRKYGWDEYLERFQKLRQDAIAASLAFTKEGYLADLIKIAEHLKQQVLTSKRVSASKVQNYLKVIRSIAEHKGWITGPDNPETLSEMKLKKLMAKLEQILIETIEKIPGGAEWIKANPEFLDESFKTILEAAE
jgi:hypothetical protein